MVYVWVVSLLVGLSLCVLCSHIIWPWLFDAHLPADLRVRHWSVSLLGLWGNWWVSDSVKGSLAVLHACDVHGITCNLSVT